MQLTNMHAPLVTCSVAMNQRMYFFQLFIENQSGSYQLFNNIRQWLKVTYIYHIQLKGNTTFILL